MLCPKCGNTMREREKSDVLIDVCPGCSGIWLEAGELQKLIESERRYYELLDGDLDALRLRDENLRRGELLRADERPRVERYSCRGENQAPKKRSSFLSNVFEALGGEGGD